MKPTTLKLAALALAALAIAPALQAATIVKADNADALNLGTSWVGGIAPGTNDIAKWDATVTTANTVNLGANFAVQGVQVGGPGGLVTLNAGFSVTVGSSGIDLSAASQDLTLGGGASTLSTTAQTWSVSTGHTLTLSAALTRGTFSTLNFDTTAGGTVKLSGNTASALVGPYAILNKADFAALDASNNVAPGATTVPASYTANPNTGTALPTLGASTFTGVYDQVNSNTNGISAFRCGNTVTVTGGGIRFGTAHTNNQDWVVDINTRNLNLSGQTILVTPAVGAHNVRFDSGTGNLRMGNGTELILQQHNTAGDLIINGQITASVGTAVSVTKSGAGKVIFSHNGNNFGGALNILKGEAQIGNNGTAGYVGAPVVNNGVLSFNRTDAFGFAFAISGPGAVTQSGLGTLSLTGGNTYTGATNLNAGTTSFTALSNFGAGTALNFNGGALLWNGHNADITARTVTLGTSGGTLNTNGNDVTLAGAVGGSGGLFKTGSGSLTLSGANAYTGTTTVSTGSLVLGGSVAGAVTLASGTTLTGAGTIGGTLAPASGAAVSPGNAGVGTLTAGGLTLVPGAVVNTEFGVGVNNNDKINTTGSNTVNISGGGFNLYQVGGTTAFTTAGTYNLIGHTGAFTGSPASLAVLNPQPGITYTFGSNATNITLTLDAASVSSAWNVNSGGSWDLDTNWDPNLVPNGSGEAANFTFALTNPATITLDGDKSSGGVAFSGAQAYTISAGSGGNLILDNGPSQANFVVSSGSHFVTAPVTLASNSVAGVAASASLGLSGIVGGTASLAKTGSGTLSLTGVNSTYSGGTSVTGGTLAFAGLGSLGTGGLSLSGGTLRFNSGNVDDISARTVTIGADGAILDTNGNNLTLANSIGNNGIGVLTKTGLGTLTLAGANTYGGATTVNGGTLSIAANAALGIPANGAGLSLNGATLQTTATFSLDNGGVNARAIAIGASGATLNPDVGTTLTIPGTVSGSGQVSVLNGGVTLAANNFVTFSGPILIGGTVTLGGGQPNGQQGLGNGAGTITFQGGTLVMNGSGGDNIGGFGTLANPLVVASGQTGNLNATYRGAITGALTGSGTLNVNVPYTRADFSGNWSAFAGTVNITGSEFRIANFQTAVFNNSKVHLAPGVLLYQTFNPPSVAPAESVQQIGELSGEVGSILGGQPVGGRFVNWTIGGLNTSSTFAGVIQNGAGEARITKVGSGTLILTGNCTYTSTTTINAGILQVGTGGTTGALGTGDVIVNSELVFNRSGDLSEANIISGSGNLIKNGSSTLTLTGASTHSGITTVNVGKLLVDGSLASATVGVGTGATLGGTGSLSGAVTVPAGATLSPGSATAAVESLGLGSATVAGTVQIEYDADLPAATDSINVTGALNITGATLSLANVSPTTEPLGGPAYILASYGSLTGTFATVTGLPDGYVLDYAYNDGMSPNHIALVAAPSSPIASWASDYGLSGGAADPAADPDGDGYNNLAEFAFNSVPNQSGPNPRIAEKVQNVAGQPTLTYTIPVRTAASTVAVANGLGFEGDGIRYNIQGGTVIGVWTHSVTEVTPAITAGLPVLETGWGYRTFSLGGSVSSIPKGFLRVQVDTLP